MKTDLHSIKDSFQFGYDVFEPSMREAQKVTDLYHNRHYTDTQIAVLKQRGQPVETFNVVKMYSRVLLGYFSTVINSIKIEPTQTQDTIIAALLNDTIKWILDDNDFEMTTEKLQLDAILRGVSCVYIDVIDTETKDKWGRAIYKIKLEHVPSNQIIMDPMSTQDDSSDARFVHRFKWITKETLYELFPQKAKECVEYHNHLDIREADFEFIYGNRFSGKYVSFDNYLVVHSIVRDEKGKTWSIFWCGEVELSRKEVTYKKVPFPYRVFKTSQSDIAEYYGVFREVAETQIAINQALLQIQLLVNTNRVIAEGTAVENWKDFERQFNRVNAIIKVNNINGIRIEKLSAEIQQQYAIIDKALERIQRVLGINDTMLGMAYAADSGRKVKLQQNAGIIGMKYFTSKISFMFKMIGWDIVHLAQQYLNAEQMFKVSDEYLRERWVLINQPMMYPTGKVNPDGTPNYSMVYEEAIDPANGKPIKDENGKRVIIPVNDPDTDISFADVDVRVESAAYNDADERDQILLETFLQGPLGQTMLAINPVGYMKIAGLNIKALKSRYSMDISDILMQTSQMMGGNPQMEGMARQLGMGTAGGTGGPDFSSSINPSTKLPTNTQGAM